MIVLSGTWGHQERRFHYPIALAQLFDAPLERVHVVVKLHPSEKDEGPYRAIIEGLAAAGGFAAAAGHASSRRSTSTGCSPPPTPTSGSTRRC